MTALRVLGIIASIALAAYCASAVYVGVLNLRLRRMHGWHDQRAPKFLIALATTLAVVFTAIAVALWTWR